MAGKFEVKVTKNGHFLFNLKAANGEVILTSQSYQSKDSALLGIEAVRKAVTDDKHFDRKVNAKGEPYFSLLAGNNENLGKSEGYSSNAAMENGIASVKKNAADAKVVEVSDEEKK
jgi:uncharacterized protein YegP (UPF0339 family)